MDTKSYLGYDEVAIGGEHARRAERFEVLRFAACASRAWACESARRDRGAARAERRGEDDAGFHRRRATARGRRPGGDRRHRRHSPNRVGPVPSSGIAPQETGVYPNLSCRDNLRLFAGLRRHRSRRRGARVIDELAESLGLTELLDRSAKELSGGERRRLHTAIALVGRPAPRPARRADRRRRPANPRAAAARRPRPRTRRRRRRVLHPLLPRSRRTRSVGRDPRTGPASRSRQHRRRRHRTFRRRSRVSCSQDRRLTSRAWSRAGAVTTSGSHVRVETQRPGKRDRGGPRRSRRPTRSTCAGYRLAAEPRDRVPSSHRGPDDDHERGATRCRVGASAQSSVTSFGCSHAIRSQ